MGLKKLSETPPWDWPEGVGKMFYKVLADDQPNASDRILAEEPAGDFTVINDELVDTSLSILQGDDESEELRGKAAISLGPILEHADMDGFDDPDDVPISEDTLSKIQKSLHRHYLNTAVPKIVRRRILEASVRGPQDWHLCSAGNWQVDAAWLHISGLISAKETDKSQMLAAIDAAVGIRPQEAGMILVDLTDSDDADFFEATHEAMAIAEALSNDKSDEL